MATTPAKADLNLTQFTIANTSLTAGGTATVSFSITNVGNAPAGASTAGIYLSVNGGLTLLRTVQVPQLGVYPATFNSGNISVALPSNLASGSYSLVVVANIYGTVAEVSTSNNARSVSLNITSPDLRVSSLSVGNPSLAAGSATTVNVTIQNSGKSAAPNYTTTLLKVVNSAGTVVWSTTFSTNPLGVNASQSFSASLSSALTKGLAAGSYSVTVVADANNVLNDSDRRNNTVSTALTITRPDLRISSLSIGNSSLAAGSPTTVSFGVQNVGNAVASASTTSQLKIVNGSGAVVWSATFNTGQLGVNVVQTFSATLSSALTSGLAAGTYSVVAVADVNNALSADLNRGNNTYSTALTILPPQKPDLIVSALGVNGSPTVGGSATLSYTLTNQGNLGAGSFQTRFYLSRDGAVDSGDAVLGTVTTTSLQAGLSMTGTLQVTLPSSYTAGTYSIIAVTDYAGAVGESRKDNNARMTSLTVVKPLQTAASIFSANGGELTALSRLASAAYIAPGTANSTALRDYNSLTGNIRWLTNSDIPSISLGAVGNDNQSHAGLYVNQNAGALIGRSADALFISFTGTNDTSLVGRDHQQWIARQDHWSLFSPLVSAINSYLSNPNNSDIKYVYVTGHSLGAAMAQEFMAQHPNSGVATLGIPTKQYSAITFASPGYNTGANFSLDVPDDRIVNIWNNADPILAVSALGQRNIRGDEIFVTTPITNSYISTSNFDLGLFSLSAYLAGVGSLPDKAFNDLLPAHNMDLYLNLANAIDRFRQMYGLADGLFNVDTKADRTKLTLDFNYTLTQIGNGPDTSHSGPDTLLPVSGQNWVNSMAANLVKNVSDYFIQQTPTGYGSVSSTKIPSLIGAA